MHELPPDDDLLLPKPAVHNKTNIAILLILVLLISSCVDGHQTASQFQYTQQG
jgi:hypothetical protein